MTTALLNAIDTVAYRLAGKRVLQAGEIVAELQAELSKAGKAGASAATLRRAELRVLRILACKA